MLVIFRTVGERIRYYRNQKGLRIIDLASRVRTSKFAVLDYEADKIDPTLECLNEMAAALNIQPDKLYDDYLLFRHTHKDKKFLRKKRGLTQ